VHAPNWNFNVSHEGASAVARAACVPSCEPACSRAGDYVVLAAEPLCVCGVDVAAPGQLRRRGTPQMLPMREHLQQFKRQFTAAEVAHILSAGSEGASHTRVTVRLDGRRAGAGTHLRNTAPACATDKTCLVTRAAEGAQQSAFQRIWSLKEAMVKARGDGLAYDLGRAEFTVHDGGTASLLLDSAPQRHWCGSLSHVTHALAMLTQTLPRVCTLRAFNVEQLGPATAKGTHWARTSKLLLLSRCLFAALTLLHVMQVTVARCRPQDVVDAVGSFRATLLVRVWEV
jgi:hypothetical protein